jgi:hypothetical protein
MTNRTHLMLAAALVMGAGAAIAQPGGSTSGQGAVGTSPTTPPGAAQTAPGSTAGTPSATNPAAPPASTATAQGGGAGVSPTTPNPGTPAMPGATGGTASGSMATDPSRAAGTSGMPATSATAASQTPGFMREVTGTHYLASRLDGADVYNSANEKIADVEDFVIDERGQIVAVILAYGGVAGIAQSYVAVSPQQLQMQRVSDRETRITSNISMDELRRAPTFSYSGRTSDGTATTRTDGTTGTTPAPATTRN